MFQQQGVFYRKSSIDQEEEISQKKKKKKSNNKNQQAQKSPKIKVSQQHQNTIKELQISFPKFPIETMKDLLKQVEWDKEKATQAILDMATVQPKNQLSQLKEMFQNIDFELISNIYDQLKGDFTSTVNELIDISQQESNFVQDNCNSDSEQEEQENTNYEISVMDYLRL